MCIRDRLGIDPKSIHHILITHQDTDHVGAVEADSPGLFRNANLYIGEIENRYLTGEERRKVIYHLYKLPQVTINNEKVLLHDGQVLDIDGVKMCIRDSSGTCARSFYVGDVKKEDIHAKFEDGILHVELPAPQQTKALPENPNLIAIE